MPPQLDRDALRELKRENSRWPRTLTQVPPAQWPAATRPPGLVELWRSRSFLVQVFAERKGITRLSVCRTTADGSGRWHDGITWDELQQLKRECGRGDLDAVEVYPRDGDVVNVANFRHLFVFDQPLDFVWRRPEGATNG